MSHPKRLFVDLTTDSSSDEVFSTGFHYAKKYPKCEFMHIAESEDGDWSLGLVYELPTPTSGEIIELLKADKGYVEYLEIYRAQVEDEMNDEMDNILDD